MGNQTSRKKKSHIAVNDGHSSGAMQWFLENDPKNPVYRHNNLDIMICGQKSFERIANDIKAAQKSILYICWGFDPAMEFTRSGSNWPRGELLGDLLAAAAERGVMVRVLCWYAFLGSAVQNNMPGNSVVDKIKPITAPNKEHQQISDSKVLKAIGTITGNSDLVKSAGENQAAWENRNASTKNYQFSRLKREQYNRDWWAYVKSGRVPNLFVRTRDGSTSDAKAALKAARTGIHGMPDSFSENILLEKFATHHQKTILIDYDWEGGKHAVGYVMGLNSVTDYWDTDQHYYNDSRRGAASEGHSDQDRPILKPFRDYACRLKGEALKGIYDNFKEGWNLAENKYDGSGNNMPDLDAPNLAALLPKRHQSAQINRTQPEAGEHNIDLSYRQAFKSARAYIYMENQYYQHKEMIQYLKETRKNFLDHVKKAGGSPKYPTLYLFIVTPTPEDKGLIPMSYDTVDELGQGNAFPEYRRKVMGQEAYEKEQAQIQEKEFAEIKERVEAKRAEFERELKEPDFDPNFRGLQGDLTFEDDAEEIKTVICQLYCKNPNGTTGDWIREIYVHSKLTIIDDGFVTLGSANFNLRSMSSDSELNISSDDPTLARELRRRVWDNLAQGNKDCTGAKLPDFPMYLEDLYEVRETFKRWEDRAKLNRQDVDAGVLRNFEDRGGFLVKFKDERLPSFVSTA